MAAAAAARETTPYPSPPGEPFIGVAPGGSVTPNGGDKRFMGESPTDDYSSRHSPREAAASGAVHRPLPNPPGSVARQHMKLPHVDEVARAGAAPAAPGFCVDEICTCSLHKCKSVPPPVPFDADTTYRVEYKHKEVPRSRPAPPAAAPRSVPFDADTSYRLDYKKWPLPEKPSVPEARYRGAAETRDFATESRAQYVPKEIPTPYGAGGPYGAADRGIGPDGKFDGTSMYRSQFGHKDMPRGVGGPFSASAPRSVPFEATTHYRDNFVAHTIPRRADMPSQQYRSAPDNRDFTTQYRGAFKGVMPTVCPITRLPPYPAPSYPRHHAFWDTVAKRWY